jgi:hypothetical protein
MNVKLADEVQLLTSEGKGAADQLEAFSLLKLETPPPGLFSGRLVPSNWNQLTPTSEELPDVSESRASSA